MAITEGTAIVFIASRSGRAAKTRALWRVTVEDAMKICGDDRTRGQRSALHWTAKATQYEFVADDGRYDDLLKELGVTVLESKAMPAYTGKHRATAEA
jgi:hypothetical protein